jgi:hypothetical protein
MIPSDKVRPLLAAVTRTRIRKVLMGLNHIRTLVARLLESQGALRRAGQQTTSSH